MIKVLIVDDEKIVHHGLQALADWESHGFSLCHVAYNGVQALNVLRQNPDIRIVLTDLQMPKMDGLQLLEEIKRENMDVKTIVLSAHDRYDLIRRAFKLGISDYIIKTEMTEKEILAQFNNAAAQLTAREDAELIQDDQKERESDTLNRYVIMAREFIKKNYGEKTLSLKTVSEYVGLSENHLSRIFAKQTGSSFIEYITELRIEKAKTLLKETNLKVYEVAEQVGFANAEYFSKVFKKVTGKSPNHFV